MNPTSETRPAPSSSRAALLALTAVTLVVLALATWNLPQKTYTGIQSVTAAGEVEAIDPAGPAATVLEGGDVIVAADGVPFAESREVFAGLRPGEAVRLTVERGGRTLTVELAVTATPRSKLWPGIPPLVVGLAFAVAGAVVLYSSPTSPGARLFFVLSQVAGSALGLGLIGVAGGRWAVPVFNALLWLSAPLVVHLHLAFPRRREGGFRRLVLGLSYGISGLAGALFLLGGTTTLVFDTWLYSAGRLYVALAVLITLALLVAGMRAPDAAARRASRTVLLSGGLAMALFVVLAILPDALAGTPLVPYPLAMLLLLAIPAGYGWALRRQ